MSLPEHVTDHVTRALARVIQQYKGLPKIEGLIAAHAAQAQEVEDALWDLGTKRYLDDAEGVQLDRLGEVLVEPRGALLDAQYSLVLAARIRMLRSSGTVEDILAVMRCVLPTQTLALIQWYPAAFTLDVHEQIDAEDVDILARILRRSRAAGVRGQMIYTLSDPDETFLFADADVEQNSDTQGFADTAMTIGGYMAGAAE